MTRANQMMQSALVTVNADESIEDVLEVTRNVDCEHVVVLDNGEVAAVLEANLVNGLDLETPGIRDEMIGNLASVKFRTCRPDDDRRAVWDLMEKSDASVIVVTESDGRVLGTISKSRTGLSRPSGEASSLRFE